MYLSQGLCEGPEMSRPQFPANPQLSTMSGHIVNGGLIDFQDNLYRGVSEYASFSPSQLSMMQAQQAQQPGNFMPMHQQMPVFPSQVPLQGLGAVPPSTQLSCISGPPAYLHVNGQTYVPVEAQTAVAPAPAPKPAVEAAAHEPAERLLTDADIEERVRRRVDQWAASQRKPVYYTSGNVVDKMDHAPARRCSEEMRAAERIRSYNAGMRGRFTSPL
jgi:hypothetical protein